MSQSPPAPRGRSTGLNPANRFEPLHVELAPDLDEVTPTTYFRDSTRRIIARNDSPDVPFTYSINPYRGCEHGCAYCYARPGHEYLGFSPGLDFESKIVVKADAPALLRKELSAPSWTPSVLAMSGVTDAYQPVESKLELTRGCLSVLAELRHPVTIVTKNALVVRDLDLLGELARHEAASVFLSITTLDDELCRAMEPRTSRPSRRLDALKQLADAGIPCGVMVAPVIPGLNDHEIPAILEAAAAAGARQAGKVMLRLPGPVADLFEHWLERYSPERRRRVMQHLRSMRGDQRNDAQFGSRMRGHGAYAEHAESMFAAGCRRHGLNQRTFSLRTDAFRRPGQCALPFGEDSHRP
ncbi:MAG: PA0069 family radical SAM protein [Acidobacteria bacterium]|nr:PA0069 family radical SAM protein [Acidobacteriota bacterium]